MPCIAVFPQLPPPPTGNPIGGWIEGAVGATHLLQPRCSNNIRIADPAKVLIMAVGQTNTCAGQAPGALPLATMIMAVGQHSRS